MATYPRADIVGIHYKCGLDCYSGLVRLNGGHSLGILLKRADLKEAAVEAFQSRAQNLGLPRDLSNRVSGWNKIDVTEARASGISTVVHRVPSTQVA